MVAAFDAAGLPLTPAYETGDIDEVCTLYLTHDPQPADRLVYVWLFKTNTAAREYARPDAVGADPPIEEVRRVRNVVVYLPRMLSRKGKNAVETARRRPPAARIKTRSSLGLPATLILSEEVERFWGRNERLGP